MSHLPIFDIGSTLSALRFLLDLYKTFRLKDKQSQPAKEEEILQEAVRKADEMTAPARGPLVFTPVVRQNQIDCEIFAD